MAITALPQTTIHLLGSAQALTTPTALVKELIDNSIDAHATSIEVLVSPNTLEKIEVRDNGHGIAEDDLDALGRRGHTSKLRTFEDLKSIGGVTLGFRGEALASACQLGDVSVTTRTDGEPVANSIKLKAAGGIASQTRISHPVGTTVTVSNFMYKIPVRKHKYEKDATKTLTKVRELLQAYALARPYIRFALKVKKGGKGSWSYAPRPSDGIKGAVSQILSRDLALQCAEKSLNFHEYDVLQDAHSTDGCLYTTQWGCAVPKKGFLIEAYLPTSDADPTKIGYGQYISVDSRPVASDKGTMKKIVVSFKYYVNAALSDSSGNIRSPFMRMNIKCPQLSYDPNVEPAKDDVLFANESLVLDSVEALFKDVYGEKISSQPKLLQDVQEETTSGNQSHFPQIPPPRPQSMPVLLGGDVREPTVLPKKTIHGLHATNPAISEDNGMERTTLNVDQDSASSDSKRRRLVFDMSKDYSEIVEGVLVGKKSIGGLVKAQDSVVGSKGSSASLNPWLIAKLNTPVRVEPSQSDIEQTHTRPGAEPPFLPTPAHSSSPAAHESVHHISLPAKSRVKTTPRDQHTSETRLPLARNSVSGSTTKHTQKLGVENDGDDGLLVGDDSETYRRKTGFISARHAPLPEDDSPTATSNSKRRRGFNKPFVSPLRRVENPASIDSLRKTTLTGSHSAPTKASLPTLQPESSDELAWAMDYENRKENIAKRRRDELQWKRSESKILVVGEPVQTSPHKNRYNAAIATLEADSSSKENVAPEKIPFKTLLPDGDSRAYFMRRQKSMLAEKAKTGNPVKVTRAKSMKLPLERVPDAAQLHNVCLGLPADIQSLERDIIALAKTDTYVSQGIQANGLKMSPLESTLVAARVEKTILRWANSKLDKDVDVVFGFENLITSAK